MNTVEYQAEWCAADNEGYLWFAGTGILVYNDEQWDHYNFGYYLEFVFVDSRGNRWFGGSRSGKRSDLIFLSPGKVQSPPTGIKENKATTLDNFDLSISPNPSNPQSTINYRVPETGKVSIEIYNLLGQKVITLLPEIVKTPGKYSINWNGKDRNRIAVSSGIYLCLYRYNNKRKVVKFTVLK